jgi:hypothetical protein
MAARAQGQALGRSAFSHLDYEPANLLICQMLQDCHAAATKRGAPQRIGVLSSKHSLTRETAMAGFPG